MKHNNQLPNGHFRKHWQVRVKTWLDQAGRKKRRRTARQEKAKRLGSRPVDTLRPAVQCPTLKYNGRARAGRGFTFEELKAAGVTKLYAKKVGIAVDHRRRNRSEESLQVNKDRLQAYLDRLVILKKGDKSELCQVSLEKVLPIKNVKKIEGARKITEAEKNFSAFRTLRNAWGIERFAGIRAKRAAEKAEQVEKK